MGAFWKLITVASLICVAGSLPAHGGLLVFLDVQPQSCPNRLNMKSGGVLPVAVLGTAEFDITEIDIATVRLNGVPPTRSAYEDVSSPLGWLPSASENCDDCLEAVPDGFLDLLLKFSKADVSAALGAAGDGSCQVLNLIGNLHSGGPIDTVDIVIVKNPGQP